jgi:hypothetical protein
LALATTRIGCADTSSALDVACSGPARPKTIPIAAINAERQVATIIGDLPIFESQKPVKRPRP